MTSPLNQGILGGFPPSAYLGGGASDSIVVYSNTSTSLPVVVFYVVPFGVTRIVAEVWSGGAGMTAPGGANEVGLAPSGGYALVSFAVQPGETLTLTIGNGGAAASGSGADTTVANAAGTVVAKATGATVTVAGAGTVGDFLLSGGGPGLVDDATIQTEFCARTAPRAQAQIAYTGASLAGVVPGSGGVALNAGGNAAGGGGRVCLWVPTPVVLG